MNALHLFASTYGWGIKDVESITYAEASYLKMLIEKDRSE